MAESAFLLRKSGFISVEGSNPSLSSISPGNSDGSSACLLAQPAVGIAQEVVSSMLTWGAALPCSSMAERLAVNGAVVGSSPTRAAIHCRVDELVKSPVSETGVL